MKQKLLLKTMLLLCALIVGSSSVWAEDEISVTILDYAESQKWTSGTAYTTIAINSDVSATGLDNGNNSKYYSSNESWRHYEGDNGTITIETTSGTLNSVTFTYTSGNSGVIKYGDSNVSSGSLCDVSGETSVTFSVDHSSGTKKGNVQITKIEVNYTPSGGGSDPSISVTPTSLSTFTYVQGNGPSATKTVSVSGSNLTENISLSLGESSNYEMCLTENGSYTNSLSLTPTTGTVSATNVYVRMKSGLTAGDKNGTITLTSDGADDINVSLSGSVTTLAVTYDANGAGSGTAPTDATSYAYNAKVTVLGNTGSLAKEHYTFGGWNTQNDGEGTNYSAGDKFDITANTTLYAKWVINSHTVTLPATDAFGEYTMNKTNDVAYVAYGTEVTLTYTPASGYENYVATWSVNGTPISGNKFNMPDAAVTVTVSLNEVFDMTLSNSDIVGAGDAADSYAAYSMTDTKGKTWNSYAIKKAHSGATSSYHYLQIKAYSSSTAYYIQVPEYGRKITKIEMTVSSTSKPMDGGGNGATIFFSASNSTSTTGTGVASGTGASKVTIDCSSLNLNTGYITASAGTRIWDVKVTYDPIRLNGSGYATYAGLTPIDYSDDSKFSAWAITAISGDAITFSQITGKVPAGTGVLLMGTAGQAVEPVVADSGTAPETNLLTGFTTATDITDDQYYGLSGNKFVKVNEGTVKAGKALLPASKIPTTARELKFVFEDETTAIRGIENGQLRMENSFFDLQGRKIAKPTKGLYIKNGKKVIVK